MFRSAFFIFFMAGQSAFSGTHVPLVVDGDTIELGGTIYRINGIDAPEMGQKCKSGSKSWPCGKEAANLMVSLVQGQAVDCVTHTKDQYGRQIATCYVGEQDLGAAIVEAGLAWAYVRFSDEYVEEEQAARDAGSGIWSDENQPAWAFREERWNASVDESPEPGCPIKGNISKNGLIYHAPWSPWYGRTKINEAKGERWFCDELEAVDAGWRAPYWP